jgi:hypothetical protein
MAGARAKLADQSSIRDAQTGGKWARRRRGDGAQGLILGGKDG